MLGCGLFRRSEVLGFSTFHEIAACNVWAVELIDHTTCGAEDSTGPVKYWGFSCDENTACNVCAVEPIGHTICWAEDSSGAVKYGAFPSQ